MAFDASAVVGSTVVFLGGDDSLARADALQAILAAVGGEEAETERVQGDAVPPSQWFGTVSTVPFFSDRRVLVVRSVGRCDPSDHWDSPIGKAHPVVRELTALPETAYLLLVHDDEAGSEERQAKSKRVSDVWAKLVAASGGKVVALNVDLAKTKSLVLEEARNAGKKITPMACTLLCEMVGSKPNLAVEEFQKVALFVGDSDTVTEADVRTVVMPDNEYNVFELVDAVVAGNAGKSVAQLRLLFGQTTDVAAQLFPRVIPMFMSMFRSIWQARFCMDEGSQPLNPSPEVAAWLPEKKLRTESPTRQNKAVAAARRLDLAAISRCMDLVVETEAEAKGMKPSLTIQDSLERMVLEMCRVTGSGR